MAKLVPSLISDRARKKSGAEGKIFDCFVRSSSDDKVVVLHSLDFIEHEKKVLGGECDFLIIFKGGIFGFEVKGGGVGRDADGQWYSQNRTGKHHLRESPIEQIKDAMGSLKRWIKNEGLVDKFGEVVFGWAVVFPDVVRPDRLSTVVGPGVSDENVFFEADLHHDIQKFVNNLARFFSSKADIRTRALSAPEVEKISHALRGEFFLDVVPRYKLSVIENFQLYETDQQYRANKFLLNGDALVTGGAGTGKTIVAIRFAGQEADRGHRVLVICFNRKLKDYITGKVKDLTSDSSHLVQVMTVNAFLFSLIKQTGFKEPRYDQDFDAICELAFEAILSGAKFDFHRLICDEAQDYLTGSFMAVLDAIKEQGAKFSSAWFLDPRAQASVFGRFDRAQLHRLKLEVDDNYQNLTVNCRNTNQIRAAVDSVLEGELREICNIEGPVVDWLIADEATVIAQVNKAVFRFMKEGLEPKDIKIISLRSLKKTILSSEVVSKESLAYVMCNQVSVEIHTASSFKGLEAPGVIVVDVFSDLDHSEDWVRAVLYVAMTRATYLCSVITDQKFNDSRIASSLSRELHHV